MPSRPLPPLLPSPHHHPHHFLIPAAAAASATVAALLVLLVLYFYLSLRRRRSPTLPFDFPSPSLLRRFPFSDLHCATASFDPSRLLGRGASASVFLAVLPNGKSAAVKLLDASSSPVEFKNELQILAALPPSPFIVSLLGYCHRRRGRLLVYEYLPNGSLQESLFRSSDLLNWDRRFQIILDVAKGLEFLHLECDPPVIHGDIKPSNVLLGPDFRAKIADFGLARIKTSSNPSPFLGVDELSQDLGIEWKSQELCAESPKVDFSLAIKASCSNSCKNFDDKLNFSSGVSPKEVCSVENSKELNGNLGLDEKDWWWKQEESGELTSNRDYVREWIGSQIYPSVNPDWDDEERKKSTFLDKLESKEETQFNGELGFTANETKNLENKQGKAISSHNKSTKVKEWWKEEYFNEMSKKGKCNNGLTWFRKSTSSNHNNNINTSNNNNIGKEVNADISFRKGWKKKRSKSMGSEMFSGDLFSRELSSTATSMRGTICYVAPEHSGCEKADIYSFGVLMLVIVSGRRPLHVLSSPMKLERANLISWCRQLANSGNVLDLVDDRLKDSCNKEQVILCIKLALLCLQKLPELRPDSGDIVKILEGVMDLPVVPFEFSPSPNSKVFSRSRRKGTPDGE